MRKFIMRTAIFASLMVALDFAAGKLLETMTDMLPAGGAGNSNYICNEMRDDIVILGSSRALHHYNPVIIADSTGLSCFNCAKEGNGIILMYGRYRMVADRYTPKAVLYEVTPLFDLAEWDNHTFLPELRHFYGRPYIDSIFLNVDATERYKMLSHIYRYNSQLPLILAGFIGKVPGGTRGYIPLYGTMRGHDPGQDRITAYDSLKLYYLERLINDCHGRTQLVFTASPWYGSTSDSVFAPVRQLCEKYGVPFINHYSDPSFCHRQEYFANSNHLNRHGSEAFTRLVASELKKVFEKDSAQNRQTRCQ